MTLVADPRDRTKLQILCAVMLASALFLVAVGYLFRKMGGAPAWGSDAVSWAACALALVSPLEVALVERVRRRGANPFSDHLVPYALYEGAALFCGVALLVGGNDWPLLASVVPLGAMILLFPRSPSAVPPR